MRKVAVTGRVLLLAVRLERYFLRESRVMVTFFICSSESKPEYLQRAQILR